MCGSNLDDVVMHVKILLSSLLPSFFQRTLSLSLSEHTDFWPQYVIRLQNSFEHSFINLHIFNFFFPCLFVELVLLCPKKPKELSVKVYSFGLHVKLEKSQAVYMPSSIFSSLLVV